MGFYLVYQYLTGGGGKDHVGPFDTADDAEQHRKEYGPTSCVVTWFSDAPSPLMSPQEHIDYLISRL